MFRQSNIKLMGVVIKCSIFSNLEMKGYMEDTQMKIKRESNIS